MRREAQVRAEEEQREAEEARQRAARWEEWVRAERRALNWMWTGSSPTMYLCICLNVNQKELLPTFQAHFWFKYSNCMTSFFSKST